MQEHKIAIATLLLLIATYLAQTLILPPEAASLSKYHLAPTSAQLLRLTFALPLIGIWCIALYGYIRFSTYALSIRSTLDGSAFESLSHGLLALALWPPAYTVIQNTSSDLWHRYPSLTQGVIIVTNLIYVGALLTIGFLLWRGSRKLLAAGNILPTSIHRTPVYIATLAFAILIGYLVLFSPARITAATYAANAYYLPGWLLVVCIVIPYAAVWYANLEVVQNIYVYQARVKGIVYKLALRLIAYGMALSIIAALALRTLSTLPAWLDDMALRFLLLIIYALVILFGIGYLLISLGTKKLQLIEKA